jgi:hypothetical protein
MGLGGVDKILYRSSCQFATFGRKLAELANSQNAKRLVTPVIQVSQAAAINSLRMINALLAPH